MIPVGKPKSMLTDLELDHDHRWAGDEDRVDPTADSRDIELKEDRAVALTQRRFERCDLAKPSVPL